MTYRRATGNRAFHFNDAFVRAIDPNSLASEKGTENRSSGNIKDPTIKIYVKQRGRQRRELPRTKEENDLLSFSALQLKAETAQFATVRTADPRHTGLQQGSCTDRISIIITIIQLSASLHWNSVMGKAVGRGRGAKPRETFGTHTKMPGVDAYSSMLRSLGRIAAWIPETGSSPTIFALEPRAVWRCLSSARSSLARCAKASISGFVR